MQGLLERQDPPPLVVMEFAPLELDRTDPGLARFRALLDRHGYRLHAFIANDRLSMVPPRISLATLLGLYDDFRRAGENAEFDILLVPPAGL